MQVKVIPLGRPLLAGSSTLTRTSPRSRGRGVRADRPRRCPYSSLLREGLAPPPVTRLSRVGSYPTISPLPVPRPHEETHGHRRCRFCGAFPRVTPGRCYRPPCPAEPGLSSRERSMFTSDLPAAFGGPAHPIASIALGNVGSLRNRSRTGRAPAGWTGSASGSKSNAQLLSKKIPKLNGNLNRYLLDTRRGFKSDASSRRQTRGRESSE
jgi:hypothetical protein